jgi:hypothetical protein
MSARAESRISIVLPYISSASSQAKTSFDFSSFSSINTEHTILCVTPVRHCAFDQLDTALINVKDAGNRLSPGSAQEALAIPKIFATTQS